MTLMPACTCPVNGWFGTVPPLPCPVHDAQFNTPILTGWQCPCCRVVHAPHVDRCDCAAASRTTTGTAGAVSIEWAGHVETVKP